MSPRKPTAAARKPTAAERLTKGSPVTQPAAGRTVTGSTRVRPVRVTVDLDPGDYDSLRDFAHQTRMSHSAIMRELIELLNQPSVSQQISVSRSGGVMKADDQPEPELPELPDPPILPEVPDSPILPEVPEPELPEPPLDYLCDYPMPGEPDPPPPMSQIIEVVRRREPRARGWFHQAFEAAREHRT